MLKKALALMLSLLMVVSAFVGCGKKNADLDGETTPEAQTTIVEDTESEEKEDTEKGTIDLEENEDFTANDTSIYDDLTIEDLLNPENFQGSDIPEDRDYGGYVFRVLGDTVNVDYEFIAESDGDIIKEAVINRQAWIEEYIGIDFTFTTMYGGYGQSMQDFCAEIEAASGAGTPYDLALAYNLIPPIAASKGLSRDLAESTNLNLLNTTKEYWGKEIKQEIMIGGRIFWMSDNSSWNNVRNMLCIFANPEFVTKINPSVDKKDLYDMVDNGVWTFENMLMLIQDAYENSNIGDDTTDGVDDGDMFGLQAAEQNPWLDTWLYAAGFRYTKLNNKGTYEWTLEDQAVIDFIDWWQEKLLDDDIDRSADASIYKMFCDGRSMFSLTAIKILDESGYDINFEFTVLPMPLYNKNVKNSYSTPFSNTYSSWLIPKATKKEAFERSATVLELLAAEGNRRLAPVYFEIYLKRQTAGHDEDMQRMFNIIRNSIVFDMGYLYGSVLTYEKPDQSGYEEVFLALRRVWGSNGEGFYANITTLWASIKQGVTVKLNNLMVDILDY